MHKHENQVRNQKHQNTNVTHKTEVLRFCDSAKSFGLSWVGTEKILW